MPAPPPVPCVVLRHDLPDSDPHYDWLIGNPADPTGRVIAYRTDLPPAQWRAGRSMNLHALPDHRRKYLHYEGPIGGGRGRVRRIVAGSAWIDQWSDSRRRLRIDWGDGPIGIDLVRGAGSRWRAAVLDV